MVDCARLSYRNFLIVNLSVFCIACFRGRLLILFLKCFYVSSLVAKNVEILWKRYVLISIKNKFDLRAQMRNVVIEFDSVVDAD